jgi:hypothetical protein
MTTTRSTPVTQPTVVSVRAGWAAVGDGWAVFAPSRKDAMAAFEAAILKHEELAARPMSNVVVRSGTSSERV